MNRKTYENGVYRYATSDEISDYSQSVRNQQPSVEDRVQILEEALKLILSGATS